MIDDTCGIIPVEATAPPDPGENKDNACKYIPPHEITNGMLQLHVSNCKLLAVGETG